MYVAKKYNYETKRLISETLQIDAKTAIVKEAATYLVAKDFTNKFVQDMQAKGLVHEGAKMSFVTPLIFVLDGEWYFAEKYIEGDFVKYNNNCGYVLSDAGLYGGKYGWVASTFCHYVYEKTGGQLMVVDIQGWVNKNEIILTDPQIHSRSLAKNEIAASVQNGTWFQRFSLGNLGFVGMIHFFYSHSCTRECNQMGYLHPMQCFTILIRETKSCNVLVGGECRTQVDSWMNFKHLKNMLVRKGLARHGDFRFFMVASGRSTWIGDGSKISQSLSASTLYVVSALADT